ncbi:hypothetical protein J1614_009509 [Plenodomus biglobosus]|nr:hypothetical protein J1614_009509 [Plenodomus biglobosus]
MVDTTQMFDVKTALVDGTTVADANRGPRGLRGWVPSPGRRFRVRGPTWYCASAPPPLQSTTVA